MTIKPILLSEPERKTLLEGLDCLGSNLPYEDFDHLEFPQDKSEDDFIGEMREQQAKAIQDARAALNA